MNTTILGKHEDLLPGTFTRMFIVYLFILARNWKQLETGDMNNIIFCLYNVRLLSSKNKCPSAIFMDMDITKNKIEWKQQVSEDMCSIMSLTLIS